MVRLRSGARLAAAAPDVMDDIVAADVVGAMSCKVTAASMIGLRVTRDFGKEHGGIHSGVVSTFITCEGFDDKILHTVQFDDGDIDAYAYDSIMSMHSDFLDLAVHPLTPAAAFRGGSLGVRCRAGGGQRHG